MDTKLQEYAKLLIEVGLNVQKGQTLIISSPVECASFARLCADAAYDAGCREVIMNWSDDYLSRQKFLRADASVFDDTPEWREKFFTSYAEMGAAYLAIAASDPETLKGVDPDRLVRSQKSGSVLRKTFDRLQMSNGFFGFPQMGVAGAAVSTVISKAVGLTLACITLKRKCTVRFSLQYLRPFPAKTFRALLGIALPSGTEALSYNVSQTFILRFINLMGAAVVSAKVYGSMLANVAYVYSIAVGQATQIILGYMIGGRKLDEVSGRVWSTIRIALAASELLTLLILIFCDPIYNIFTDDPVIHALGRQILYVEFGLEIGRSINIVMTRCLTTAGDVWYPVGVGIFSMWIVAVGGSWLLGHALNWGLVGIWIAMACDECLRGALFTIRFRSGKWKETRLVSDSTKGT